MKRHCTKNPVFWHIIILHEPLKTVSAKSRQPAKSLIPYDIVAEFTRINARGSFARFFLNNVFSKLPFMTDQPISTCASNTLSDDLIQRLTISAPRYTSYPTADRFRTDFTQIDYLQAVYNATHGRQNQPLAIYIHIPFCAVACFYCACHKISTQDSQKAAVYVVYLIEEIKRQAVLFRHSHEVCQIHFGGGTPTFLSDSQIQQIIDTVLAHFSVSTEREDWSIEIDPRTLTPERLFFLKKLGFSRVSFGVQDTNETVQLAIGRQQPFSLIQSAIAYARQAKFSAIGFDLIYGLPHQTLETYQKTLSNILSLAPDYVSFFNYAHLPSRFPAQRRIEESDLPDPATRIDIMHTIIERMTQAGYLHIGLDHFARQTTRLAQAAQDKKLYRNFQGYSAYKDIDLLGMGLSAISQIGPSYAQNETQLDAYQTAIEQGCFATVRGICLSPDDTIRQAVIQSVMCRNEVVFSEIEEQFGIIFTDYFSDALKKLGELESIGLVIRQSDRFYIPPARQLFLRHVALLFDNYINRLPTQATYSKAI